MQTSGELEELPGLGVDFDGDIERRAIDSREIASLTGRMHPCLDRGDCRVGGIDGDGNVPLGGAVALAGPVCGLDGDPGAQGNPQTFGGEWVAHRTEGRYADD
jgi:hypothetical protein